MLRAYNALHDSYRRMDEDRFVKNCAAFFSRKQDVLDKVVKRTAGGRYYKNLVKTILDKTKQVLSCPFRALKAIIDLQVPVSRYEEFAHQNMVMGPDHKFVPATVEGVPIPNFWAPNWELKDLVRQFSEKLNLRQCGDKDAYYWPVEECLQYVIGTPSYFRYVQDSGNLEIICRGDGMPVGSEASAFLIVTLGNFGQLSKCLGFNFPVNLAEVNEKNREEVRALFKQNLDTLNKISQQGYVEVFPEIKVKAEVHWGGDECWLRMMLGLLSTKELLACLRCFWERNTPYSEDTRIERCMALLSALAFRGSLDQKAEPLIRPRDVSHIHPCGMHAIIPFGKDLLWAIFNHLKAHNSPALFDAAQAWFKKNCINVKITKKPNRKKWNIKACQTWTIILHWEALCNTINLHNDTYNELVEELVQVFHVIYTWAFNTLERLVSLQLFDLRVSSFVDDWRRELGRGKDRNYYHFLAVEAMRLIRETGSIWKYSSDITESFVHVIKDHFARYSSRGGGKKHWTKQVMKRVLLKVIVKSMEPEDQLSMLTPYERKKLVEELLDKE